MTNRSMRDFIDIIKQEPKPVLEEGVIDSIKKWIDGLNDPIKSVANEYLSDLQKSLSTKFGATVSPQIKSNNNSWMFGKLSYNYLYNFIRQLGFDDYSIDIALKNPIVVNTLNRMFALLPKDTQHPSLPLTSQTIKNSPLLISPMIDKKTKVYAAKTIASIIFDSLAYLKAEAQQRQERMANGKSKYVDSSPYVMPNDSSVSNDSKSQQDTDLSIDELKAAVKAIKAGLSQLKQNVGAE